MRTPRSSSRPAALLLLIALAFSGWQCWQTVLGTYGLDFYQFWVGAQVVAENRPVNLYDPAVKEAQGLRWFRLARNTEGADRMRAVARERKVLDTQSTPFLYTVFALFTGPDYETDYRRFQLLSLILGGVALLAMARCMGHSWVTSLAALLVTMTWFQPFLSELRVGNVSRLQLLGLAAYVAVCRAPAFAGRHLLGGALLAAGTMFKPSLVFVPLLALLASLVNGRPRKTLSLALGLALGGSVCVALGAWYFGSLAAWSQWLAAMPELMKEGARPLEQGNYGLTRLLQDASGQDLSLLLTGVCLAVCGGAFLWFRRPAGERAGVDAEREFREDVLALALGSVAVLLSAGLVWIHYLMLLVPALLLLLNPVAGRLPALRVSLAAVAFGLLCLRPIDHQQCAWVMTAATLLIMVLCLWELTALPALDAAPDDPPIRPASSGVEIRADSPAAL